MENQIYGYIRVSSRDQNEDRQVIAMREFGIAEKNLVSPARILQGRAIADC